MVNLPHEPLNLSQVLECGNGACDIAAFGLKQALTHWIAPVECSDKKSGEFAH